MRASILFVLLFCYSINFVYAKQPYIPQDNNLSTETILKKIESKMKSIKTVECNFVQEKKLNIMNMPIVIKGRIYIQSPNYFAWHGVEPVKYSMVIKGHILKQWDEDSDNVMTIDLNSKPIFKVLISQMQNWFSDNYLKQAEDYNISIIQNSPLVLKFSPKPSSTASEFVSSVRVSFKKDLSYISSIKIHEKNKDFMTMTFNDVKLNSKIPADIWSVKK